MSFGKTFLNEIQELFVQILLLAQAAGVLKLGNISLDGSKVHADASTSSRCSYGKSKAVSYKRLIEIESQLRKEVGELFALGEQVDQGDMQMPEGLDVQDEIAIREERLASLAKAKPKNAMRQNRPSMKPSCASVRGKHVSIATSPRDALRNRPSQAHATKTSTISPTRIRAS